MNAVGIVSIALGVPVACGRGAMVVAPAATLRWIKGMIRTNGRIRVFGAFVLPVGATMVWAGASEDSGLAGFLLLIGLGTAGIAPLMVLFPGAYRALANAFLPSDPSGSLTGWRMAGLAGVIAGVLLIYFGARAL